MAVRDPLPALRVFFDRDFTNQRHRRVCVDHGCPLSFTFETPSHAALPARVAAQCAAVRAACRHLTDQIRQG